MAKRLIVVNPLRPKINSQGVTNLERLAGRVARYTTFNEEKIYRVSRSLLCEANSALQRAEIIEIDGLAKLSSVRIDREVVGEKGR